MPLDLEHALTSDSYVKDMKINESLSALLTLLMEDSWNPDKHLLTTSKFDLFAIKQYLDEHYTEKVALEDLSKRYFINKFYLTRVFKEKFGVTINAYLMSLRITKAKSDLRYSDKSLEQIGIDSGIGAGNYFSRVFMKVEGQTPSEYRNSWRSRK